jgi:signal transduction histidine kinase
VQDDGRGLRAGVDPMREGHGLDNVRQRLATLYGEAGRLSLRPGPEGKGALALLVIPDAAVSVPADGALEAVAP